MRIRLLCWLVSCSAVWAQTTLYVSTAGRLDWSGRLAAPNAQGADGPLPSLAAARDAIRGLRAKGVQQPVTVLVRGGAYYLPETFVLRPEDSGTPAAPVVYAAYPGERPIISGGRRIENWRKGQGPLWTANAPFHFRQLFISGRRAQRARTPNFGFFRIDGPSSEDKPFKLKFRGNDIRKSWEGGEVEVIALLAWAEIRMPIVSVDETQRVAVLTGDPRPSNREPDARYFIENAPDALDSAGEWYLDRKAGVVSYRPLAGEDMTREEVIAPALTQLVRLEGNPAQGQFIRNVTFRGLDFRHSDWSMGPQGYADTQAAIRSGVAVEAIGAEDCAVERCAFSQHGGYAIWFGRAAKRNRIAGNQIFDMGAGGIKIGEETQRQNEAEQSFDNAVTDNYIHDLGLVYPAAVGVWVGQSSRATISHNHIHDLYYTAISVGWTWGYGPNQSKGNTIAYNHLHRIGKGMMSDMGGIYTLGMQPGTVVRNNLIHDIASFTYGGWGIYPDEGSTQMLIENNVVYDCKSAGFHQHYGRENIVRNNVFALNKEYQLMRSRAEPHRSFTFERNIVYFDSGRLLGSNWTGDQFLMDRNVYFDVRGGPVLFSGRTFAEWRQSGQDRDSVIADPLFVNPGNYDFSLRPDSPALKLGFQPIDLREVGPRPIPEPAPAAWADPDRTAPAGAQYRTFRSSAIGGEVSYLVYLPPDYQAAGARRYPVVYWLHGLGGNQRSGATFVASLDAAIKAQAAPPMIAVLVNGLRDSRYCDSFDGQRPVETVIVKDLIPHVDQTYRTIGKREARAIEGFSMGGFGAAHLGFKYPELFGAVSIMAGALLDADSVGASMHSELFEKNFGSNRAYFQANSPWVLVEKNAGAIRGRTLVRIAVGDQDSLLERDRNFHALLDHLNIQSQFETVPGVAHNQKLFYEKLGARAFQFYRQAFGG